MIKYKYLYVFICFLLMTYSLSAQKRHKLDSLKMYNLDKKDYKMSLNEFDKVYGFNDTAKYIIDIYRYGRGVGKRNTILSLPLGAALYVGADYAIANYVFTNDEARQSSTFLVVAAPIVVGSVVYFIRGLVHLKIYTKKHLLQDLVLYRQKKEFRSRVYQYMDDIEFKEEEVAKDKKKK